MNILKKLLISFLIDLIDFALACCSQVIDVQFFFELLTSQKSNFRTFPVLKD